MKKDGFYTTEFWGGVAALAAIANFVKESIPVMLTAEPMNALGMGIAVAGGSLALAYLAGKYAAVRTEAKSK